jgi:hypothetical protein
VPFELVRHRDRAAPTPEGAGAPGTGAPSIAPFQAFTEDRRIVGRVRVEGRLSDTLNRRVPVPVFAVSTAPLASRDRLDETPDLRELDPYELVVVASGPDSQSPMTAEQRAALRTRRDRYEVCIELTGASVCGVVHLHPGTDLSEITGHRPELFVPVTEAVVRVGSEVEDPSLDVAFVNRAFVHSVVAVDDASRATPATGEQLSGA